MISTSLILDRYRNILLFTVCLLLSPVTRAQDTLKTQLTYKLSTEVAAGTGDYTAYQLVTNRHHVLATRPNTAYMRGALNLDHQLSKQFTLSAAVDAVASVHADHKAYLQQCYANLSYHHPTPNTNYPSLFLELGSREQKPVLRDEQLSVGQFVNGTNAKPIPQVHFGTNGFWSVPFTKDWLQVHFDMGYGMTMDSHYREDAFFVTEGDIQNRKHINLKYAKDFYYHQKHLYLRSNPQKPLFVTVGIEHVAQFGGSGYEYRNGILTEKKKPADLKAFTDILLPRGDANYFENDAMEDWCYGNHIGMMTCQIGWNINKNHRVQAYLDNPFEDGSGIRKGNGWDGLWGLQYDNNLPGRQYVRHAVVEYFQSTNQSGPLHWDSGDYPQPIRSQITDLVVGNDYYYHHTFYDSYSHFGMTPGIALITSPIYNKDGFTQFVDSRVKAWHIGVNGDVTSQLSYLVKGSYREGWGTYDFPLSVRHHSFDAMIQGQYHTGPWQFSAAFAFDKGNIYGDCSTFDLKICYYGKIL